MSQKNQQNSNNSNKLLNSIRKPNTSLNEDMQDSYTRSIKKCNEMEMGFVKKNSAHSNSPISKENPPKENLSHESLSMDDFTEQAPHNIPKLQAPLVLKSEPSPKQSLLDMEDSSKSKEKSSDFQLILTPSMCTAAFISLLIAITAVFFFGYSLGKSSIVYPEKEKAERIPISVPEEVKVEAKVIPQEDLTFMKELQENPPKHKTPEDIEAEKLLAESKKAEELARKQAEEQKLKSEQKVQVAKSSQVKEDTSTVFDFNIRLAAFRDSLQADKLRERLEGAGYRTVLTTSASGRKWYFVHVLLRGTEKRLQEAREDFKKFAIRDSIIQEKTPVN